jgi:hypothetical protein
LVRGPAPRGEPPTRLDHPAWPWRVDGPAAQDHRHHHPRPGDAAHPPTRPAPPLARLRRPCDHEPQAAGLHRGHVLSTLNRQARLPLKPRTWLAPTSRDIVINCLVRRTRHSPCRRRLRRRPRHAGPPSRLALVAAFQFLKILSDRQAADAIRARSDWKYALGLEPTAPASTARCCAISASSLARRKSAFSTHPRQVPRPALAQGSRSAAHRLHPPLRPGPRYQPHGMHSSGAASRPEHPGHRRPGVADGQQGRHVVERYGRRFDETRIPAGQEQRSRFASQRPGTYIRPLQPPGMLARLSP